jgi:hypothetical protein
MMESNGEGMGTLLGIYIYTYNMYISVYIYVYIYDQQQDIWVCLKLEVRENEDKPWTFGIYHFRTKPYLWDFASKKIGVL